MKKFVPILVFVVVAAVLAWFVWLKPASHEEPEAKPATEVPVHVGKLTRATLRSYVTAYGVVEPEPPGLRPAASARVAPFASGVVTVVKAVEGQRVEKGALLFQLDSRAADAAVEKQRKSAEFAALTLDRQKKLLQVEGTSQKLLLEAGQAFSAASNELAAAQIQRALLDVEAPLSGTVVRVNVKPGEAVDLTTIMAEVIDLDRLVVAANVPGGELSLIQTGAVAEITLEKPAAPVSGILSFISPQVDAKSGTAPVRASIPGGSGLRPGQWVTLRIVSQEHKDCLTAPLESVVKDEEGGIVIGLVQGDKSVLKLVKTGLRDAGLVEVEGEGLQADMEVVTEGAYGLPKETKIRVLGK